MTSPLSRCASGLSWRAALPAGGYRRPALWLSDDEVAPVAQLSFYEAAAYAQRAKARLPTEFEWEAAFGAPAISQMTGCVWQWTRPSYDPYPGFRPLSGAVSEYNGKFMVGQVVLRGSSSATAPGHARATYRNFFRRQPAGNFPACGWQRMVHVEPHIDAT